MRLSKTVYRAQFAAHKVLEFVPPKFDLAAPEQAIAYLEQKKVKGSGFRMSDVIRVKTGVEKIEARNVEDDVEQTVLVRLKEVQETAYQEAYQLGLSDGKNQAFQQSSEEIQVRLSEFDNLVKALTRIKTELLAQNEAHLVQLAFHMAKRLAHKEVQTDPEIVVQIIKEAIEMAQIEEQITIRVAPAQLAFFETLKAQTGNDLDFLKKAKFEAANNVSNGGCVIETNYGQIDAKFEERVEKLWTSLSESLHRVKDRVQS
jgi:flagellar assembly protein FliH